MERGPVFFPQPRYSGARIAWPCRILEDAVSREFSRQLPKGIPLKKRRKRYEASAAHTWYRENRKKSKLRGKSLPLVIETAEKLIRCGYPPDQRQIPSLKAWLPQLVFTAGGTPAFCCTESGHCSGIKAGCAFTGREERQKNARRENLSIPVLPATKTAANSGGILSNPDVIAPAACLP